MVSHSGGEPSVQEAINVLQSTYKWYISHCSHCVTRSSQSFLSTGAYEVMLF